ncbi:MOSC domain-containing protein [Pseudomonas matsuisoli]|uniref:Sulfurase n=1 Tax=Pseudomonas matsuisoli TaxID=1515666 RepID=A0A917UU29_9PSED|nr:2Fe-2S iron-sulfur cluster-binding protein [Pseudomonas matsuisoli]GGJ85171.1 sulfurase [Pseudomonas matsuisoli]
MDQVALRQGEGVPGDRVVGITKSKAPKSGAPFHQLTTNADLVHFQFQGAGDSLALVDPRTGGDVDLLKSPELLREFFGDQAEAVWRKDRLGHWDFDDSMLSIINVSTVEALSAKLGIEVDPIRFRGNIYIEAEPFIEFSWLGQGVQIGDVCLSIVRPIKRCSATSVDPQSGERDINMPAQLNRHLGHFYCGVYAQVESEGVISPNDPIATAERYFPARLATAVNVPKAPPAVSWPRPARVVDVVDEAEGIRSLWLQDPLADLGSLDAMLPGQHIALHGLTAAGDWRRYTISGRNGDRLRITVKRDSGVGSGAVHEVAVGQLITVSGPFGPETLDTQSPATFIISAGIGITPTLTKLKALADVRYDNPIRIVHSVRRWQELALWDEVKSLASNLPNCVATLHITALPGEIEDAVPARPDTQALVREAAMMSADIHLCGSEAFQSSVLSIAEQEGVADRLHMDSFVAPDSAVEMRPIPDSGPYSVTFQRSGITAQWLPENGPLLDFAEAKGLVLPAHCRAGLCMTCQCALLEGDVLPLIESSRTRERQALLCASVPSSDIVLDC